MFTDSLIPKREIYRKWAESGYKQPQSQEILDVIVELQSKGHTVKSYEIMEHDTGSKYTVTEHQEPKTKQEKSTAELIEEAKKIFQKQEPRQQEQTKIPTIKEFKQLLDT